MARFIPFDSPKLSNNNTRTSDEKIKFAISISIESAKLLEETTKKEASDLRIRELAENMQKALESLLNSVPEPKANTQSTASDKMVLSGTTAMTSFLHPTNPYYVKAAEAAGITEKELNNNRLLDNGGMAPPKEWKSITEINLKKREKDDLISQMRTLKDQGKTITKSKFHHKMPITVSEFTEPFKYLENMHDYNGAYLISLLKSELEIDNQASTFQIDLNAEKESCMANETVILSVYDITGSSSNGEEKKFLILLSFDALHGTLVYDRVIFPNGKNASLSQRQKNEIQTFCKTKKVNYQIS